MRWAVPFLLAACASVPGPGDRLPRRGSEIVVCGELFEAGTRVVLWTDPGGFDAYRTHWHLDEEKREPRDNPHRIARYGSFRRGLPADLEARVRDRGWTLGDLRQVVTQVVLHYDAAGTSARCFHVLHHVRGLSAHFLVDTDGTVYQTLDLKERAWHAGSANDRSVGIEIANLGAYPDPARGSVAGRIHGGLLYQEPYTDAQYRALRALLATLSRVLPRIRLDAPRGEDGRILPTVLAEAGAFEGILGHYHLTESKVDPGPAFEWRRVISP